MSPAVSYSSPLTAAPAQATHAVRRPFADVPSDARAYAVRMRDGVRLATDVYLPAKGFRWPALLARLPYDKAGDECFMPAVARRFTERGYAVVIQDVRGKIRSDGALEPFRSETVDGYDTIDWITAQSWCTGSVGMIGDSYYGWTQWAAAASRHPALQGITPRVISGDASDIFDHQGVLALEVCALWALETWVDEALYDYESQLDWSARPLSEIVPTALDGRRSPFLDKLALGGPDPSSRLPILGDVPALHLGGWWDIVQRGQLATWRRARQANRKPQFLIMDATDHGWTPLREPGEPYLDPGRDERSMQKFLDGYLEPLVPFLDHFVAGKGSYKPAPVRWRLSHDSWRESESWPPAESRPMCWYLSEAQKTGHEAGELRSAGDSKELTASWIHDPLNPVPSKSHAYYPLISPAAENTAEARNDVLLFQSDPVRQPLDLAGPAELALWVSSSNASSHFMAKLLDVEPGGEALTILDGAARASGPWPCQITIDLGSTGYRILPGHRLRLEVSSSAFPKYILHPGTEADPWTTTEFRPTEQQLIVGGARGAQLRCFVLPIDGVNS